MKLPPAELEEQFKLAVKLRDEISRVTQAVNQLRSIRSQLKSRNDLLKDNPQAADLIEAVHGAERQARRPGSEAAQSQGRGHL